uniref:Ground-like domain-containing protein n=1 Tax=Panagrolaimus superbus TaxID=310955 RepID=A0A914XX30_9BILA
MCFKNLMFIFPVIILLFVVISTEACPGLFGGGGGCGMMAPAFGGGGCGGGCGKRKKREVLEQQVKTEASNPCPQNEWKKIMETTITDNPSSSVFAIQGALHKQYEAKFFVTCSKVKNPTKHPAMFVTNGEGYCSYGNDNVWCEAIALFG